MLIIEGCDNSGKTTLAKKLNEKLGWEVIHSPGPLDGGIGMMSWLVNEITKNPKPAIYDRISLISDKVYAPIIRGEDCYYVKHPVMEKEVKNMISIRPHLIIFCRPSKEAVLHNDGREQMDGVLSNHEKLFDSYDSVINEYIDDDRFNVFLYNYELGIERALDIAIESYLKELDEMKNQGLVLRSVFAKQKELMEKYEVIESNNGFYVPHSIPLDINDKFDQLKIKEFGWRITEEMAEAVTELSVGNVKEAKEELADVLHFMAELTIMLGLEDEVEKQWNNVKKEQDLYRSNIELWNYLELYGKITYDLGMVCHLLKNKPWKQSHKETDKNELAFRFYKFWDSYLYMVLKSDMSLDELIEEYHKKHEINKMRQESGY